MFPRVGAAAVCLAFVPACQEFGIDTAARQAMFYAQVAHESAGLTRLEESFDYTKKGLMETFPGRFKTIQKASDYVKRGPEAIANYVYSMRLGNGSEGMGHGWQYRGRGPIMLTGRANYIEFGKALGLALEINPDLAKDLNIGARIAARFWSLRVCNQAADEGDIVKCTRLINGGLNGLAERTALWERNKLILGVA